MKRPKFDLVGIGERINAFGKIGPGVLWFIRIILISAVLIPLLPKIVDLILVIALGLFLIIATFPWKTLRRK